MCVNKINIPYHLYRYLEKFVLVMLITFDNVCRENNEEEEEGRGRKNNLEYHIMFKFLYISDLRSAKLKNNHFL